VPSVVHTQIFPPRNTRNTRKLKRHLQPKYHELWLLCFRELPCFPWFKHSVFLPRNTRNTRKSARQLWTKPFIGGCSASVSFRAFRGSYAEFSTTNCTEHTEISKAALDQTIHWWLLCFRELPCLPWFIRRVFHHGIHGTHGNQQGSSGPNHSLVVALLP